MTNTPSHEALFDAEVLDPTYAFGLECSRQEQWFENRARLGTAFEWTVCDFYWDFAEFVHELPY